jgi:hypothetical protein
MHIPMPRKILMAEKKETAEHHTNVGFDPHRS